MAMTPAGERDQRIRFERATVTRSALGGKAAGSADWAALGSRWAKLRWGSGAERRAAAVEQATQAATFRVLADSLTRTVTEQDRIVHPQSGLTFDITGLAWIGRSEIEFTGVAARG